MKILSTVLSLTIASTLPASAAMFGIDFGVGPNGSADPDANQMALTESAGVFPQLNWNSFTGGTQAAPQSLLNDAGVLTSTTVTWSSATLWDTSGNRAGAPDSPGDIRMMYAYLDTTDTSTTSITVTNLPPAFLLSGYNVVVYYDGENGGNQRVAQYSIGPTTFYGRDAAGATFNGVYTQGQSINAPTGAADNNAAGALEVAAGNYMVFTGLTDSTFTLTGIPSAASDTANRAAINGLQIVQVPEPSAVLLGLSALGGFLCVRRRRTA